MRVGEPAAVAGRAVIRPATTRWCSSTDRIRPGLKPGT
ncbi:hypothetical protein I552_7271 [Mycobacterium xenopi 3993]|nr:hypothetical protein I552_7271 [Mycobacterium xenopi 3993]